MSDTTTLDLLCAAAPALQCFATKHDQFLVDVREFHDGKVVIADVRSRYKLHTVLPYLFVRLFNRYVHVTPIEMHWLGFTDIA